MKTFREAITRGLEYKKNPPEDYYSTVLNMLQEVREAEVRTTSSGRKRRKERNDR